MTDTVRIEVTDHIATITLNRPSMLNAGNEALLAGTRDAFTHALHDDEVRAVILTGAGRGFCAGADLTTDTWGPDHLTRGEQVGWILRHAWNPTVTLIHHFPKPTLAAVNGVAAGGGVGLALACDVVIAAESASFVQVFGPQLAVVPDVGSTWHLPRLVGPVRARALAMLGDGLDAARAADWGLVYATVPDEGFMEHCRSVAARLAALDPATAREIPAILHRSLDAGFDAQLADEARTNTYLGDRPGIVEGVRAFREKRPPRFD